MFHCPCWHQNWNNSSPVGNGQLLEITVGGWWFEVDLSQKVNCFLEQVFVFLSNLFTTRSTVMRPQSYTSPVAYLRSISEVDWSVLLNLLIVLLIELNHLTFGEISLWLYDNYFFFKYQYGFKLNWVVYLILFWCETEVITWYCQMCEWKLIWNLIALYVLFRLNWSGTLLIYSFS